MGTSVRPRRFDRVFRGVGKVRVSMGTHDPSVADKMEAMLVQFYDQGRLDLLEAVQAKRITPLQLYNQVLLRKPIRIPSAEELVGLEGLQAWADAIPNPATRRGYRSNIGMLLRFAKPDAQMIELPEILTQYRAVASPVVYNRTVTAVRAYLSDRTKFRPAEGMLHHPLYANVATLPLNEETPRVGMPFEVEELMAASHRLGSHRGMAWTLALTGMRRGEYWNDWTVESGRVLIPGGKKRKELRAVPFVGFAEPPRVEYAAFRRRLAKASPGRRVHDLRYTYMHWLELAGVPRTRRILYMGHSPADVSGLYERHEVEAFLADDAERMIAFLGARLPGGTDLKQLGGAA